MTQKFKFKVWWIPQMPMKTFEYEVSSREEGLKVCDILGKYDAFQFENKIKGDYCNTGGVQCMHPNICEGEWVECPDDNEEWQDFLNEAAETKEMNQ